MFSFHSMLTTKGKWVLWIVVALVVAFAAFMFYNSYSKPPIADLPSRTVPAVKEAIHESTGKWLGESDTKELVNKMNKAWSRAPLYEAEVPSESYADNKAQELAKRDKADTVLKERKQTQETSTTFDPKLGTNKTVTTNKTIMQYTAVTLDKKNAIGVYADLDKDGSYGAYYRANRTTVSVGKKYNGGGVTSRVMQDVVQW